MLCTLVMLFLYYLSMLSARWKIVYDYQPMCKLFGFVTHYSQMSAFFWLNAIAYNVWNSFRKLENSASRGKKLGIFDERFKWYALYAWGCPMICTIVTIVMQNLPDHVVASNPNLTLPKIGDGSCTLEPIWGKLFYFHIINGPILVCRFIASRTCSRASTLLVSNIFLVDNLWIPN